MAPVSRRSPRIGEPPASPFFSRAYGGYTAAQAAFFRRFIPKRARILDPMGGQGLALSEVAREGHEVWIGDMNPGPLLLASLRDPRMVDRVEQLAANLRKALRSVQRGRAQARAG